MRPQIQRDPIERSSQLYCALPGWLTAQCLIPNLCAITNRKHLAPLPQRCEAGCRVLSPWPKANAWVDGASRTRWHSSVPCASGRSAQIFSHAT